MRWGPCAEVDHEQYCHVGLIAVVGTTLGVGEVPKGDSMTTRMNKREGLVGDE